MDLHRKLLAKGNEDIIGDTVCGSNIKSNKVIVKSK